MVWDFGPIPRKQIKYVQKQELEGSGWIAPLTRHHFGLSVLPKHDLICFRSARFAFQFVFSFFSKILVFGFLDLIQDTSYMLHVTFHIVHLTSYILLVV